MKSSKGSKKSSPNKKKKKHEDAEKGTKRKTERKVPGVMKVALGLLASVFTLISALGRLLLTLFDILIPRGLRELVPLLQMYRKYFVTASEFLAGKKSKEILEVSKELEDIRVREEKIIKNYPIRRGLGEVINLAVTPIVFFLIPTAIWGEDLLVIIGNTVEQTAHQWGFLNVQSTTVSAISLLLFGTGLLMASWIATIFGPTYALFHECSVNMMKMGAYRWAAFYQDIENFFSLPYFLAKSSFSFFDAPPISTESYQDFKLEIMGELDEMKDRVQDLIALENKFVPERSKKQLESLLRKAEIPLNKLDISTIKSDTARTFALLIWSQESSIFPWRKDEALESFAKNNNMSEREAKESLKLILRKIEEGYLSHDLFSSVMITGALKGIAQQEEKYDQIISDVEYNKLAISLALGAQQYIKDKYNTEPWHKKYSKKFSYLFIAPLMPLFTLIIAIYNYIKHIMIMIGKTIVSLGKFRPGSFFKQRFLEIFSTLSDAYLSVAKGGRKLNFKKDLDVDFKKIFKKIGKFLLRVLLFVPLLIWSLLKSIYNIGKSIVTRRSEEERMKKKFEKDLTSESIRVMYQEIYDKMLLSDLASS
ncbi:MAG: hypothetical protein ACTSVO_01025 [Candidatus Heimdallarchaeaceae archaeon]